MRIQRPRISQPIITQPTITQVAALEGDGANITGSFSGSFVGELTGPTSASFATRISASEASISTLDGSYATDAELTAVSGALATSITTNGTELTTVSGALATSITANGTELTAVSGALATSITSNGTQLTTVSGALAQSITDNTTDISNNGSDISANSSSLAASITTVQNNLDTASGSLAQGIEDNASDISNNGSDITAASSSLASSITSNSQSLASDLTSTNDILNSVRTYTGSLKSAISLDSSNVTILGDLTVQGDTTTLNTATLDVEDLNITVAKNAADSAAANGAGLTVDGATATLTYASTGDKWVFNKVLDVPTSGILIDGTAVTATATELNQLDANTVGGTTAGDIADIDSTQTFTNKTWNGVAITHDYIGADAIDGTNIADDSVDSEHIADDAVTVAQIADDSLTTLSEGIGNPSNQVDTQIPTTAAVKDYVSTLGGLIADDGNFVVGDGSVFTVESGATVRTSLGLGTADDVQFDSFGVGTAASGTAGEIRATGDITAYYSSDERLKENFAPLTGALDKVKAIGGYEFDWKDGIEDVVSKKGHDIGVKAQELQAQYPELVHERDNGYLAVDYIKLNAVLIEAVKELAAKVDELSK